MLGLFGLPTGLMMVITAGGELFTGNTAFMTAAVIEGKASVGDVRSSSSSSSNIEGQASICDVGVVTVSSSGNEFR